MIYGLLQYGAISQKKFRLDGGGQWRNGRDELEFEKNEEKKQTANAESLWRYFRDLKNRENGNEWDGEKEESMLDFQG